MDYEKAYKEALERASRIKDYNTIATPQETAESIFPELKESEDERIRKELIQFIEDYPEMLPNGRYSRFDFFAWLQKQREPKLMEWSEEDEKNLRQCIEIVGGYEIDYDNANPHYSNWLKSLRPQKHWKPQKEQLEALWHAFEMCLNSGTMAGTAKLLDKLHTELIEL